MLLVTGATGNVGAAALAALANTPHRVRAFVRDPARLQVHAPNIEVAVGDFTDGASIRGALEGVETAFLASAVEPRLVEHQLRFIECARDTGLQRVVHLSAFGASQRCCIRVLQWFGQVEAALQASGLGVTHLRGAFFMQNLLKHAAEVVEQGVIAGPFRNAAITLVDARDIGAVAAVCLADGQHAGKIYELTGEGSYTYQEIAQSLSQVLGRPIRYVDISAREARGRMQCSGTSPQMIEAMTEFWDAIVSGFLRVAPSGTVRELTGRAPGSLDAFLRDYRNRFARAA